MPVIINDESISICSCLINQYSNNNYTIYFQCSVTCGVGDQYRPSLCKKFVETDICPPNDKPIESQKCHTGVLCSPEKGRIYCYYDLEI